MKRDMDLARQILLSIEQSEEADGMTYVDVNIEGRSRREISYHIKLLHQDGLVEANDLSDSEGFCWEATGLTSQGHEFLDEARDDRRWHTATKVVKEKTGGLAFEAIKAVLVKWTLDAVAKIPYPF